jgi:hypothetical protein
MHGGGEFKIAEVPGHCTRRPAAGAAQMIT